MADLPTKAMANAIRVLSMDAVEAAKSGHPGMPMGMADAASVLFCNHLKFDASDPHWADRDRFVLSAGHGSMLIYALLYLTGYQDMTIGEIRNFRQLGAKTAGHPEFGHASGIETTTGPLGQGIANAVGMAIAERHLAAQYGDGLVDHRTYVIASDGCLMEGISHEAASLAGHLGLGKLIILFDDNGVSIDGPIDITVSENTVARFEAYGWQVLSCDGHDMGAVDTAFTNAKANTGKPSLICCKTVIGQGAPTLAGTSRVHGAALGATEIDGTRAALSWSHPPFVIPDDILSAWRKAGARGSNAHSQWAERLASSDKAAVFLAQMETDVSADADTAIATLKATLAKTPQKVATRVASQKTIEVLLPVCTGLFGGSADLTGSNNTKVVGHSVFSAHNPAGSYIHFGVREHGMAAAMNGIALHGGLVPYGGTFMVFTDYCRPSIRLSALMQQQVIYVMTHDSIGLGEDGPTHQPVEHLASLRAIPNLNIFRPADIVETAECWQLALSHKQTPSILALSRQGLDQLRLGSDVMPMKSDKGGYVLHEASSDVEIVLMASGSEVQIAKAARKSLEEIGHPTRLVSVPCLDLLMQQAFKYRESLIADAQKVIVIEAGIEMGWSAVAGPDAHFIGMHSFGASAPIKDLYAHFGITKEAVITAATAKR